MNTSLLYGHGRQPNGSASSEQAHQEGLGLVVHCVAQSHSLGIHSRCGFGEEGISSFPRPIFQATFSGPSHLQPESFRK